MENNNKLDDIKEFNDIIFSSTISKHYQNLIFIYTPPKVGSTALVSSLRLSCSDKFLTIHVHDEKMLSILTGHDNKKGITINDIIKYNAFLGKNIFIIDVYRNPIERKMSEYFELISNFHFNNSDDNLIKYDLNLLINRFNKLFPFIGKGDYFFDKYELSILIPEKFDFEKRFLYIKNNNINYIKLRLCDSNRWGSILSNILKTEIIIIPDYKTENKIIGELYKQFKKTYKIPENFLENITNCNYFNYYNSDREKDSYLNYWNSMKTTSFQAFNENEYKLYMEITSENQYNNFIQRNHYLDIGCICRSCFYKRKQIINKIKKGENVNLKVIHEEAVAEKKMRKMKEIVRVNRSYQQSNAKLRSTYRNRGTDFSISGILHRP
jgi:hypothetical protein